MFEWLRRGDYITDEMLHILKFAIKHKAPSKCECGSGSMTIVTPRAFDKTVNVVCDKCGLIKRYHIDTLLEVN